MNTMQNVTTTFENGGLAEVHPLDTLLVQQIEDLIRAEAALAEKYPGLKTPVSNTNEVAAAFSADLAQLNRRADRLWRLIDAMGESGSNSYQCV